MSRRWCVTLVIGLVGCGADPQFEGAETEEAVVARSAELIEVGSRAIGYDYARLDHPPAGVAGGQKVVFVGDALGGRVVALDRFTSARIGELPPPTGGFLLPFIVHSIGPNRVAVLDAGGLPSPDPFVPANPTIYEYEYEHVHRFGAGASLTASLVKTVSFSSAFIGFAEDFVKLSDGRYVLSDAILGGLWIATPDGDIEPGIVPETMEPEDQIPELSVCPEMPMIDVGGVPFLFSGATLPGVSPLGLAERAGLLYFYSPCAEGLYAVPLAALSDARAPHERAADIRLVAAKPADVPVEQLLGLTFNPFSPWDRWLYAADSLQLRIIRIDVATGRRQVVADHPELFNFPSSLAFLPPVLGVSPLVAASNQQHRLTLTNAAISEDLAAPPFIIAKIFARP